MGFTIVLGLAVLSAANYGHTFTITGVKPTVQPVSPFTTQQPQLGDLSKSTASLKNEAPKPFGAPFEPFKQPFNQPGPFKQPYQPYQPGGPFKQSYQPYPPSPFRTNYQPFGPYPGYPGPVVYPGQVGYPTGPSTYPQQHQAYHFDDASRHKQFGYQPFPSAPVDQTVGPFKFGGPLKKFNKSPSGYFDFNQPGKYFQEHQFSAYHGPEFSSAIVPAEHNLKQSKPKDIFLGKPAVPALPSFPSFGLSKEGGFGLPSPSLFGYHSPIARPTQFGQSFFGTPPPSVKNVPSATQNSLSTAPAVATPVSTEVPSPSRNEETATSAASEVTGESSSETPAADPEPTEPPAKNEGDSAVDNAAATANNNEAPTASDNVAAQQDQQSEQSNSSEGNEPKNKDADADAVTVATAAAAAVENTDSAQLTDSSQVSTGSEPTDSAAVSVEEVKNTAAAGDASSDSNESSSEATVVESSSEATVVESSSEATVVESSSGATVVESSSGATVFESSSGPTVVFESSTDATVSDGPSQETDSAKSEQIQSSPSPDTIDFPNQQAAAVAAPLFDPSTANLFATSGFPYFGQSIDNREQTNGPNFRVKSDDTPTKTPTETPAGSPAGTPAAPSSDLPKKINTVQIIQDGSFDPFNGQLPLLYDPSSAASGSPLDTYGFYNHPSVSALSSQAALASYSPEDAFSNFGTNQFRTQGYLVEGFPSLTPLPTKTIVQTGRTPVSISSKDHPLHGQVFKYSQSFVPYPALVQAGNTVDVAPSTTTSVESGSTTTIAPSAAPAA